jgi:hypothetical protein
VKKTVGILVAVVVVAIAIGGLLLSSRLNSLVAKVIEREGSKVTTTSVGVSGVEISLREGRGTIDGLRIASPDGYEARDAFTLGKVTIDIDVKSVTEDPIVIDEIRISEPVVSAEFDEKGASNIDEIRKRVQGYRATQGGGDGGSSGAEQKRIRISPFVFEKGRAEVDTGDLGVDKRTIDLPEIRLTNLGGINGARPDAIAKEIVSAIAKKVTREIAGSEVEKLIKDQLGGSLEDKAKGVLDKITR